MNNNQNHITDLTIKNFKSIKEIDLKCKRINIFVGKPNVGKSNILEALSLLSRHDRLKDVIRFNNTYQLFYDNDTSNTIEVITNQNSTFIHKNKHTDSYDWLVSSDKLFLQSAYSEYLDGSLSTFLDNMNHGKTDALDSFFYNENSNEAFFFNQFVLANDGGAHFIPSVKTPKTNIKKYLFNNELKSFKNSFSAFLETPDGNNLLTILTINKSLRTEISSFFEEYGLEFLIDQKENIIELFKKKDGISFKYSYELIADTLRRIIFYLAAIKSNDNSVLLFEEPESHCFPPYIAKIADEIVESETNQFFVATHSPYLLNTIIENTKYNECAVFVTSYKNHRTLVRELSQEEISDMLNFGTDVFINYSAFVN